MSLHDNAPLHFAMRTEVHLSLIDRMRVLFRGRLTVTMETTEGDWDKPAHEVFREVWTSVRCFPVFGGLMRAVYACRTRKRMGMAECEREGKAKR